MHSRLPPLLVLLVTVVAHHGWAAAAERWPAKPIRLIVPFPAGSASDTAARLLGHALEEQLGQTLIIDNRAGASGNIGVEVAAHAPADGYTLVLGTASTQSLAQSLNPNLAYDPINDFAPISLVAEAPYVLVVNPGVPANSVPELIALAKAKPGALTYGSAGPASLAHLAGELFADMAGVTLTHVPYKSSAQSVIDIAAGRIDMQFATIAPTLPYIRNGRLHTLGVTGSTRVTTLPAVPTIAEAALPGYDASLWLGLLAPAHTARAVIDRLNAEVATALATAPLRQALVAGLRTCREHSRRIRRAHPERFRKVAARDRCRRRSRRVTDPNQRFGRA